MSNMDCGTCHNMHTNEVVSLTIYSQKCIACHNAPNHNFCTNAMVPEALIKTNCIDCHMPATPSKIIYVVANGQRLSPYSVRSHYITIYPEESKKQLIALVSKMKTAAAPAHRKNED
jgi:hypothetical protein